MGVTDWVGKITCNLVKNYRNQLFVLGRSWFSILTFKECESTIFWNWRPPLLSIRRLQPAKSQPNLSSSPSLSPALTLSLGMMKIPSQQAWAMQSGGTMKDRDTRHSVRIWRAKQTTSWWPRSSTGKKIPSQTAVFTFSISFNDFGTSYP